MTIHRTGTVPGGAFALPPENFVFEFVKNGAEHNMIQDYSSTEGIFKFQPGSDEVFLVSRMIITIKDAGSIDADNYGNGVTLTNGIVIRAADDSGVLKDITAGVPIKTNGEWATRCYDVKDVQWGAGDNYISGRWTLAKNGALMKLDGSKNARIEVVLNDDFSGLTGHTIQLHGIYA